MLESTVIKLLVATVLGFLSGLGVGGGSLLMLWLTLFLHHDPLTARSINLLFFLPAAVTSLFFRWKQGSIHWKTVLPAMLAGIVSAALFSILSLRMDVSLLKKLFGILLIATGLRELLYRQKPL